MLPTGTSVNRIVQAVGVDVGTVVLEAVPVARGVDVAMAAVDVAMAVDVDVPVAVLIEVDVPVGVTVRVAVLVAGMGVTVGPPMGPAGKGHANAPRLLVHTDRVVNPRSICISNMNA